jgi:Ca-activated chloride channel family protein
LADDSVRPDQFSGIDKTFGQAVQSSQPDAYTREIELAEIEASAGWVAGDLQLPLSANPLAQSAGVLGMNRWDDLPELPISPISPVPHGLDWPMEPPANRPFLQHWGFHPFVSPGASPRLQTCPVPLAVEPSSYELARRYLERNEWPPTDRIRTEEFLAAVDYNFPKPTHQSLGLTVAGGPSPISGEGFCLLQVGVQAQQTDLAKHEPVHLVLLIDTSTSMRWGSRMEIVRRALHDLPGMVAAEDRLSLVTFDQAAHVWAENLGHNSLRPFAAAADSLAAKGATNIVAGLREAYGRARPTLGPGRPAVRVVLLTDGLLDLEPATARKIEGEVSEAAKQKIPLDVIDLGQQKETDPQVASLSQAGGGTVRRATSAAQVRWALREIVSGRSQLVARAARLQIVFNPKSVLEYRLVGHESGDWGGLLPGPLEADFREGQTATALFEVRLAPNGPNDLASAELTWYMPDGEKTLGGRTAEKARVTVERKHFASSLTSSATSLQEAAVVAYATEVLRHSPFIFQRHPGLNMQAALLHAVELSGQVDSQLQLRPSFDEFVALVRQEMKGRPAKRSAKD